MNQWYLESVEAEVERLEKEVEQLQGENERLREALSGLVAMVDRWIQAYSLDLIRYPTEDEIQAVNRTREFTIGRNALMQVVSEGLARSEELATARAALVEVIE